MKDFKGAEGAKRYFGEHLRGGDYYGRDAQELAGQWQGRGAELLGLKGNVDSEDFCKLLDNINPETGKQLTARTRAGRKSMTDVTFDVPKEVSLAYELGGHKEILDAVIQSVRETMRDMELDAMTRVRKGGADELRASSNLIWGEFLHKTARPVDGVPEPQLHVHCAVLNASFCPVENQWKAADIAALFRDKGYHQAAFHSRLSNRLREMGYGIERAGKSFRLAGIDKSIAAKFSSRTAIIDAEAERLGITDAKSKGELARLTREKKATKQVPMDELRAVWNSRLSDDGRQAIFDARHGHETRTLDAAAAMDYATLHSFERESVITEKQLLTTALIQSVGNASVGEVKAESFRANIFRKRVGGQMYATTKQVLAEEEAMISYVRDGRGKFRTLAGTAKSNLDPDLSKEQRSAAEAILDSRDAVVALIGRAGTGKTRTTQAIAKAIESTGRTVLAFAPSAKASRGVLRVEGFKDADTVEKLLTDAKLQQKVYGQVLWIDEAGLLSTPELKRIFDLAKRQNARVALSGDSSQHSSVLRGDGLRILQQYASIKAPELTEIRRQTNAAYREAVSCISQGDRLDTDGRTRLENGLEQLDKIGAVHEVEGDARYRHIAADYIATTSDLKKGGEHKTALVVSPTHAEADRVTAEIRKGLKATDKVCGPEHEFESLRNLGLTEAQRSDPLNYEPGSVVQWQKNAKGFTRMHRYKVVQADSSGVLVERNGEAVKLPLSQAERFQVYRTEQIALAEGDRLRITRNGTTRETRRAVKKVSSRLDNGDIFEVKGFTKDGDIKLTNGFVVPKDYGGLAHGYVTTSHSSQGSTVDQVLIALGTESFAAANRAQLYVSVSRGREAVRLYTDDKEAMMRAVQANPARFSATELMHGVAPVKRAAGGLQKLLKAQTIHRAYAAVREKLQVVLPPRKQEVRIGL